jgi:Fungal Zn(2)-Cys(6) binuclear cluster domain
MANPRESTRLPDQGTSNSGNGPVYSTQPFSNPNVNPWMPSVATGGATQATSPPAASPSPPHRIRRRNRMITSCLECRRRKLKCDKLHPCTNCAKFVRDCVFLAPALDSASQLKLTEIKEKMGVLERGLEVEVANAKKQQRLSQDGGNAIIENGGQIGHVQHLRKGSIDLPGELTHEDSEEDGAADFPEDEKDLEPTPLAVVDAAYDDDADDDMLDLGVKMGKMRYAQDKVISLAVRY